MIDQDLTFSIDVEFQQMVVKFLQLRYFRMSQYVLFSVLGKAIIGNYLCNLKRDDSIQLIWLSYHAHNETSMIFWLILIIFYKQINRALEVAMIILIIGSNSKVCSEYLHIQDTYTFSVFEWKSDSTIIIPVSMAVFCHI